MLACSPHGGDAGDEGRDSADSPDTQDTQDTQDSSEPCVDYAEILSRCEALAQPIESGAGEYYSLVDPDSQELLLALHDLIDDHQALGFNSLWGAFQSTDAREDGAVWDVYSVVSEGEEPYLYEFTVDRCGDYQGEGQCYNREHSYPSSWFDGQNPLKADLFHVRPTDGYVNNRRGNSPYGPTRKVYWTSQNGSTLGSSAACGFSGGPVFEPVDSVKGDLARGFLYVAARYRGEGLDWTGSEATSGAYLEPWAEEVMRAWHLMDPVDAREVARNQAVFEIQGNRNPFIDHPEWVCTIADF